MNPGKILAAKESGVYVLKFFGDVRLTLCAALDTCLDDIIAYPDLKAVFIDLTDAQCIDSTTLGFMAKISIMTKRHFDWRPTIISTNEDITKVLLSMCFDEVFTIVDLPLEKLTTLRQLPGREMSESEVKEKVLEAHKILMQLNEQNREKFKELVTILEAC